MFWLAALNAGWLTRGWLDLLLGGSSGARIRDMRAEIY